MTTTNQVQEDDQATVLEDLRQRVRGEYDYAREVAQRSHRQIAHYERLARISRDHMMVIGSFIGSCDYLTAESDAGNDVGKRGMALEVDLREASRQYQDESSSLRIEIKQ